MQYAIMVCLALIIIAAIYYRETHGKIHFTGKINAYYLKLNQDDYEVPPLTIYLKNWEKKKKINLYEILYSAKADQGLKESEKIWFKPGGDKTLILSHTSECTIVVGQTIICKRQNYILRYGDKIYVTFPEDSVEIELHYKNVKSSELLNLESED
jgi:hypothetical protein